MSKKSIKLSKVNAEHVIRESCKRYGHAGVDDTLAIIREKWNLSPNREFVEKLIRENENA